MTLDEFLITYDKPGAIVLLEGKREVPAGDADKLFALGRLLTQRSRHIKFRSGNAGGADQYFSEGVSSVDKSRMQVITPYTGHRQKTNPAYETISLDDINLAAEKEVVYQSKGNKKTKKLIDQYVAGNKNRFAIKAAYIIRDTVKVLGASGIPPANFAIFYDAPENPRSGGTGHTMKVCEHNQIPFVDQQDWFGWLI